MNSIAEPAREVLGQDLRAFPRVGVAFDATVRVQGTEHVARGAVIDLSGNGLRLTLSEAPAPGSALSILMHCDGDSILTSAEVVRSEGRAESNEFEVACRFVD